MKLIKWVRWIIRIGLFGVLPIVMLVWACEYLVSGEYRRAVSALCIGGLLFYSGRDLWKPAFWREEQEEIDNIDDD
jgi:hypothetical protein